MNKLFTVAPAVVYSLTTPAFPSPAKILPAPSSDSPTGPAGPLGKVTSGERITAPAVVYSRIIRYPQSSTYICPFAVLVGAIPSQSVRPRHDNQRILLDSGCTRLQYPLGRFTFICSSR